MVAPQFGPLNRLRPLRIFLIQPVRRALGYAPATNQQLTAGGSPHLGRCSIPHKLANLIMVATTDRPLTVFGGTGFLGRRVVRHLRSCGFPLAPGEPLPGPNFMRFAETTTREKIA
jgi:hypothetical protein